MTNEFIVLEGEVVENLPNTLFRVKIVNENDPDPANEKIIIAYLSGKMRKNYIKILPGDKVRMELSPYDLGRGRIIYRKAS
jgi:translation initiation factor IF-1